jgi:hypothetical protein
MDMMSMDMDLKMNTDMNSIKSALPPMEAEEAEEVDDKAEEMGLEVAAVLEDVAELMDTTMGEATHTNPTHTHINQPTNPTTPQQMGSTMHNLDNMGHTSGSMETGMVQMHTPKNHHHPQSLK